MKLKEFARRWYFKTKTRSPLPWLFQHKLKQAVKANCFYDEDWQQERNMKLPPRS